MRTHNIGNLEVSVIGLGCNNFGRALDADQSKTVVDAALDLGVTYFDTASNYGSASSESFLGRALVGRRSEAVIATKFGVPVPGVEDTGGAHPEYIAWALNRSLKELNTDYIDLYQLHKPDPLVPIAETIGAMNDLVHRGVVREIGCSNLDAAQLEEAIAASTHGGFNRFVSNQVHYSMVHRSPETDGLIETCRTHSVALLPFYPLASGLLTGKTRSKDNPQGRLRMDRYSGFLTDDNFMLVDQLTLFAADRNISVVEVALGWLLAQPAVPAVTPGATARSQLENNVKAADWIPTPDDLGVLQGILGA